MAMRYIVLRADRPFDVYGGGIADRWLRAPAPDVLTLEAFDGRETDGGALRADPHNAAVMDADAILHLVEPKEMAAAPADPATWPLQSVGGERVAEGVVAVGAHQSAHTGQGVSLAVLDTGVDVAHPVFKGLTIAARNFTGSGGPNDVADAKGHGTHCAGTACGRVVAGVRVGVAPGVAKLCAGKVLGDDGRGTLEMLLKALHWAVVDEKAAVVSMSLGYDLPGNIQRLTARGMTVTDASAIVLRQHAEILKGISTLRAYLESQSPAVVFVAASGNESDRPRSVLPASLPAAELVAVGAVGASPGGPKPWSVARFSNSRARVVAPGVQVLSAAPGGGWAVSSGTSMATPHAAGVAALWVEQLRNAGQLAVPDSVRTALIANARANDVDGDLDAVGNGLVQAP
jgi:subtilisin family serine protease